MNYLKKAVLVIAIFSFAHQIKSANPSNNPIDPVTLADQNYTEAHICFNHYDQQYALMEGKNVCACNLGPGLELLLSAAGQYNEIYQKTSKSEFLDKVNACLSTADTYINFFNDADQKKKYKDIADAIRTEMRVFDGDLKKKKSLQDTEKLKKA